MFYCILILKTLLTFKIKRLSDFISYFFLSFVTSREKTDAQFWYPLGKSVDWHWTNAKATLKPTNLKI